MAIDDEYVYTISSSTSSKIAELWHKTCQKQALFTSFCNFSAIFLISFFIDFDASKSVLESFFAFFSKIRPKTCITALKTEVFCDLFYLVTCDDLDLYYGHKAQEMIQRSETLSMPISWLCLCLISKFCSPMSPSPKSQTFILWPDLWRHWWPGVH